MPSNDVVQPDVLTVRDVCVRLKCGVKLARVVMGQVGAFTLGRRRLVVPRERFEEYLRSGPRKASTQAAT